MLTYCNNKIIISCKTTIGSALDPNSEGVDCLVFADDLPIFANNINSAITKINRWVEIAEISSGFLWEDKIHIEHQGWTWIDDHWIREDWASQVIRERKSWKMPVRPNISADEQHLLFKDYEYTAKLCICLRDQL